MYRAIIFDFFDVIVSDPWKAWLTKHNFLDRQAEFDEVMKPLDLGQITIEEFQQNLSELSGTTVETIDREFADSKILDEQMIPLIQKLGKNYKIGLLSNAHTDEIRPLIKQYDLGKLFEVIVISGETGLIKPDKETFNLVLEKLDVKPGEAIFVDDVEDNVEAATTRGIKALHYRGLSKLKTDLQKLGIKLG